MSDDNTQKPAQQADAPTPAEKIADLPERPVSDADAEAIKAGRMKLDPPKG